jgi:hypothetical protein
MLNVFCTPYRKLATFIGDNKRKSFNYTIFRKGTNKLNLHSINITSLCNQKCRYTWSKHHLILQMKLAIHFS